MGQPITGTSRAVDASSARLIIRVPRQTGSALSEVLIDMQGVRSAKKLPMVKVQIDPYELA